MEIAFGSVPLFAMVLSKQYELSLQLLVLW